MKTKKKNRFEEILLPAIIESESFLEGKTPEYKGLDLFHRLELMPHQCALLSTVRRKIRAQRRIEEVLGYSAAEFDHKFFTSDQFAHPEDMDDMLYMVRMALFNELKRPSGVMKVDYSFFVRCRHKNGEYRLTRHTITTFNAILHGIPTEAMFIISDFGKGEFSVPNGLIINRREPLVQSKDGSVMSRSDNPFTSRERQVLYGICMGKSSKMVADELSIAKKTVDNIRASLLEKSKTVNTAELASKAVLYSWV